MSLKALQLLFIAIGPSFPNLSHKLNSIYIYMHLFMFNSIIHLDNLDIYIYLNVSMKNLHEVITSHLCSPKLRVNVKINILTNIIIIQRRVTIRTHIQVHYYYYYTLMQEFFSTIFGAVEGCSSVIILS